MAKRKTIALLIFKYFPYGGLQRDFLEIAKELLKRNINLKVLTGSWEGERPPNLDIEELDVRGLTNHAKNINFYKKANKALKKIEPDLVFGFNKMPGLDVYLAADTCFKFFSKRKNLLYRLLPRYKAFIDYETEVFGRRSKTKALILNKKQEKEFSLEYETDKSKLVLIPPGLPTDWKGEIESNDFRKGLNINASSILLLFVGSDFQRKGLDRAIKSLSYCSEQRKEEVYLIVAGDDNKSSCLKLANQLGVNNKVIFLGPRDDIAEIMSSCDLLIHPAREEAAGNVIIESLISELPILTCEEVGFSSYVEEYSAGKVIPEPFEQKDLDNSLTAMINNLELNSFKKNLSGLKDDNYFFSRFEFVGDFIERELNG